MKPALGERPGATNRAVILAMSVAVAVLLAPSRSAGEYFDWRSVNGQDFTTPTRSQFDATCWAFAAVGALEAKYKITRNDPTFNLDFSESHLVYDGRCGGVNGGYTDDSLKWFQYNGIVLQQDYPLRPGWQGVVGKIASYQLSLSPNVNDLKSALKKYGPLTMGLYVGSDWYPSEPGTAAHAVVIVGFQDDAGMPEQGYWIVKNSWRNSDDWRKVPYGKGSDFSAITGAAYLTGALGSGTWDTSAADGFQGGGGTWSTAAQGFSADGRGLRAWRNGEDAAVFSAGGGASTVHVEGAVSAHALSFTSGAAAYALSGGTLIVTAGGITAEESVRIDSDVTVGAPQQWTVAGGKLFTVTGGVNTNISTLTVAGAGDTTVSGAISGTGSLAKTGGGTLTLSGVNTYTGATTLSGGTVRMFGSSALGPGALSIGNATLQLVGDSGMSLGQDTKVAPGASATIAGERLADGPGVTHALGALTVGQGGLSIGKGTLVTSGTATISFTRTTLNAGAARLSADDGAQLSLGDITRSAGATVDFAGGGSIAATTGNNSGGILGGHATWAGREWAVNDGANRIGGGATYANAFAADFNTDVTASLAAPGNASTGSVRFRSAISHPTLALAGANSISSGGILVTADVGPNPSLVTGGVSLTSGNGQDLIVIQNNADPSGSLTIAARITGTIGLTKSGPGTLVLAGANDYTGATRINSGVIAVGGPGAIPVASAVTFCAGSGGVLRLRGNSITVGDLSSDAAAAGSAAIENAGDTPATLTVNSARYTTFAGILRDGSGAGALSLTKARTGFLTLSGANTFTGDTRIASGQLRIGNPNALQYSTVDMNSADYGVLNLNNVNAVFGGLKGSRNVTIGAALTLSVGNNNADTTYSGALTSAGGLAKIGSGTLTLTGASTFSGTTTILDGVLKLDAGGSLASPLIDIEAGTLDVSQVVGGYTLAGGKQIQGDGTVLGALAVLGAVAPGASPGVLTVGQITFRSGSELDIELGGTTAASRYDVLNSLGAVTLFDGSKLKVSLIDGFVPAANNTFDILDFGSLSGTFGVMELPALDGGLRWDTSSLYRDGAITVVPEPASLALLAFGAGVGLLAYWRRRPRAKTRRGQAPGRRPGRQVSATETVAFGIWVDRSGEFTKRARVRFLRAGACRPDIHGPTRPGSDWAPLHYFSEDQ